MTVEGLGDFFESGQASLAIGEWQRARSHFEEALLTAETPQALEGLGRAAFWLDDLSTAFRSHERAFQLYRGTGATRDAARMAMQLAVDYVDLQSDLAIGSGWLQRAASLLEGEPPCYESGWLSLYRALYAIEVDGDLEIASMHLEAAHFASLELGLFDLQMLTAALHGYRLVRLGEVREGIRRLDESTAAAMAGEISDLMAVGGACCTLIFACEAVADFERAAQWSLRAKEFCRRWGLVSFFSICRVYYATVLVWRGDWEEAEAELSSVIDQALGERPMTRGLAICRLAELRRRQGRLEEARALFDGTEMEHLALLGRAALAYDEGDAAAVPDLIDRYMRRSSEEDRAERAFAMGLLIKARIDLGQTVGLEALVEQIEALAVMTGTDAISATAREARGQITLQRDDLDEAKRCLEDALDLFQQAGAPFEASKVRLQLARALQGLNRLGAARREARLAFETLRRLGARRAADEALALLRRLDEGQTGPADDPAALGLSRREAEVVSLIAQGKSNQDIAAELVLSVRTVERHISSIYEKLGLHGAAARAAAAAFALGHGLGHS